LPLTFRSPISSGSFSLPFFFELVSLLEFELESGVELAGGVDCVSGVELDGVELDGVDEDCGGVGGAPAALACANTPAGAHSSAASKTLSEHRNGEDDCMG